jgi:predicted nuclease of predicted toxin-antitoxin system
MRVLCERHVPPKYVEAVQSSRWADVITPRNRFHPEVDDETIARYAEANGWVVLTRDRDFFQLSGRFGFGVLYLDMRRNPGPGTLVAAVEAIAEAYSDHSEIVESVPGDWV